MKIIVPPPIPVKSPVRDVPVLLSGARISVALLEMAKVPPPSKLVSLLPAGKASVPDFTSIVAAVPLSPVAP